MAHGVLHMVGFGGQGSAWAPVLRRKGRAIALYLRPHGPSWKKAQAAGWNPLPIHELPKSLAQETEESWVALLCSDDQITPFYEETLSQLKNPLNLILAHGYAVTFGGFAPHSKFHQPLLFAPKAIGPRLLQEAERQPDGHSLRAAWWAPPEKEEALFSLARDMGFQKDHLISTTFRAETIGDLISEQGLLCGGIFPLLLETFKAMDEAGVPLGLIREECLTELELVASLLREKGPATTFQAISDAAKAGTVLMDQRLQSAGLGEHFRNLVNDIQSGDFSREFDRGHWKILAEKFKGRLAPWERKLGYGSDH